MGSRRRTGTARDLPHELYEELKTPPRETPGERKKRIQRITRAWARRWAPYEWLNPQHEEMFAVNPPLKTLGIKSRPPPAPGVVPDPTSLKTHEDFPDAYQHYLKRIAHLATSQARKLAALVDIPPQPAAKSHKKPGIKKSSPILPS